MLTFLSRSARPWAAAVVAVLGACSSSLGTGDAGGTGGAGGCHPAPTDAPFGCKPTYAEQLAALCPTELYDTITTGTCDSLQVTFLSNQFYGTWCSYGADGALVGARRCAEAPFCGNSSCT